MSASQARWIRHSLPEIGLSIEVYQPWPLLSLSEIGARGIYQVIGGGTGIVFVRYGSEETPAAFISRLADRLTRVEVISDQPLIYRLTRVEVISNQPLIYGQQKKVRGVCLRLLTPSHEVYRNGSYQCLPETRTRVCVIGFSHQSMPILVGYRLPEEELPLYREQIEHIINSVG